MTPSPELTILRHLTRRTHAAARTIGTACGMAPGEARAHLSALEGLRLVASRQDNDTAPPLRIYYMTEEGRWKAGTSSARARDA